MTDWKYLNYYITDADETEYGETLGFGDIIVQYNYNAIKDILFIPMPHEGSLFKRSTEYCVAIFKIKQKYV